MLLLRDLLQHSYILENKIIYIFYKNVALIEFLRHWIARRSHTWLASLAACMAELHVYTLLVQVATLCQINAMLVVLWATISASLNLITIYSNNMVKII